MEKKLIKNAQEIIDLLEHVYSSVEDLEYDLGVTFAYEADHTCFSSDYRILGSKWREEDPYDGEEVTYKVWRREESCILPENYPVLMVYHFENTFDYFGNVSIKFFEFVTLEDFNE